MRVLAIACLVATTSLAQKTEPASPKPAPAQQVIFDGNDLIEGTLQHPLGTIYLVPPNRKFDCLIQVRMNFNDKLRESVHEM